MGQVGSSGDVVRCWMIPGRPRRRVPPNAAGCRRAEQCPLALEMFRMRQDYLNRLGISKDGHSLRRAPLPAVEDKEEESDFFELADQEAADQVLTHCQGGAADAPPAAPGAGVVDHDGRDSFRLTFLRKLSYQKVWLPQSRRPPRHQTVIIFDWDDTLLCTSSIHALQDKPPPPEMQQHLKSMEKAAAHLLEQAQKLGRTFIITNAMEGWVEYSAARFLPGLLPILQQVPVISARKNHEAQYPCDVGQWKVQAFLQLQRQMDIEIITNLVSFGDADFEMDAVHAMSKAFDRSMVKTIKFRQNPSPEELVKQLELVVQKVERIVLNARSLKISLARKGPSRERGGVSRT